MTRLLALRVNNRLSTDALIDSYCQELANVDSDGWKYAVDCAMQTETDLPAPSWLLKKVNEYKNLQSKVSEESERAKKQKKLNADFSPEQSKKNIERLAELMRTMGNFNVR